MLIGFKRAKIQPLDSAGKPEGDLIIVEGKENEGASQEATISGLSPEPTKVWGSNVAYYVSQKGTGDVSVVVKLLDLPDKAESTMLGYEQDTELEAQFIGEGTEPPYCAITLESEDNRGNAALFGFFKGKFRKGDTILKTKEGASYTPEGDTYTYSAVSSDRSDKSKGNVMIKFLGTAEKKTAVETLVLLTGTQEEN